MSKYYRHIHAGWNWTTRTGRYSATSRRGGREKISDISNAIGIPRVTVYERMQNLVREGVIQRFTFIPNYKLIGSR